MGFSFLLTLVVRVPNLSAVADLQLSIVLECSYSWKSAMELPLIIFSPFYKKMDHSAS